MKLFAHAHTLGYFGQTHIAFHNSSLIIINIVLNTFNSQYLIKWKNQYLELQTFLSFNK